MNCGDLDKSKNKVNHESGKSKNGLVEVGVKCKKKKKHKKQTKSECNGKESDLNSQKEMSASAVSVTGASASSSETSEGEDDQEGTGQWVEKTKETLAKVNHSARIIHWNGARNMKDLSHTLNGGDKVEESPDPPKKNAGLWDGGQSTQVVDELRRAGNFTFGTPVNSWGGGQSTTDEEFQKERREMKKRTLDDLYNEEFDSGKTKKIKLKKSFNQSDNWNYNKGNVFQRVQDVRNSGGAWNNYRNSYGNNSNYGHYNNNKNNNNNNQYQNREGYWNKKRDWNKNRDRYHNRNKQWNKFDKRDHKFHKKHKEKYSHWDRRD